MSSRLLQENSTEYSDDFENTDSYVFDDRFPEENEEEDGKLELGATIESYMEKLELSEFKETFDSDGMKYYPDDFNNSTFDYEDDFEHSSTDYFDDQFEDEYSPNKSKTIRSTSRARTSPKSNEVVKNIVEHASARRNETNIAGNKMSRKYKITPTTIITQKQDISQHPQTGPKVKVQGYKKTMENIRRMYAPVESMIPKQVRFDRY